MKIFIQTTYPAPYRVELFNLINEKIECFVTFETLTGDKRNKEWFSQNFKFKNTVLNNKEGKKIYASQLKNLKQYDYVVVYEYSTLKAMKLMLKCIMLKKPYLINCDGAIMKDSFVKDKIKTFFIKHARACLASGKNAKQYFMKYGAKEKNIYFHNFSSLFEKDIRKTIIDRKEKENLRKELGLPYKKLYISVGRFIYIKGYDLLIEAIHKLNLDDKEIGFVIIGGGEKEQEYKNKLREYKISNVHLRNFMRKDDLIKYYDASDIFIFPTREDIWGLVINEAMARGLPIISTDKCIAAVELVEENKNGNIIKTDSIEQLVKIIQKYNKMDIKKYTEYGKKSIQKIQDYTIENIAKSHIKVLKELKS